MQRKTAMYLAILGGILLLISGTNGAATFETIRDVVIYLMGENQLIVSIFAGLIFVAALGGISVIAGGFLIGRGMVAFGKMLILLGSGTGLIGLVVRILIYLVLQGGLSLSWVLDVGALGLILSVVARKIAE